MSEDGYEASEKNRRIVSNVPHRVVSCRVGTPSAMALAVNVQSIHIVSCFRFVSMAIGVNFICGTNN